MSNYTCKRGDDVKCPHCGVSQDGPAEDFVVPMRYTRCQDQCHDCDELFMVREIEGTDNFEVTA